MATEHAAIFEPYLAEGETLSWTGRPRQGFRFTGLDIFTIPFSLLWFSLALAWEFLAIFAGENEGITQLLFIIFGIPFVLIGYQICIGRFFTDRKRRANTYYAITNRRALVLEGIKKKRLHEYLPSDLEDLKFTRKKKIHSDVFFGYWKTRKHARSTFAHWPYGIFSGFHLTTDGNKAYELLQQLLKENQTSKPKSND